MEAVQPLSPLTQDSHHHLWVRLLSLPPAHEHTRLVGTNVMQRQLQVHSAILHLMKILLLRNTL